MKINFLLPCYSWGPSGGFKVVFEYANRLARRGHQVAVLQPRRLKFPPPEKFTLRQRVRRARLWWKELRSTPVIYWHSVDSRVQVKFIPSSDQSHIPDADILFATAWHTVQSVLACPKKKGAKCYLIQHYETFLGPRDLVDQTWRASLYKIAVSKWLVEVGETLGLSDVFHIPVGIDHSLYRTLRPISEREPRVAMMFSEVPFKRAADGIKALEIVKKQHPGLRVVLFGIGSRASSIPAWMEYVQDPPQKQLVSEIFNNSSIVISSSLSEGFGLPPAEGAACGCAIVSTDSGGVRDFIIHGETGLLSPPQNPEALARNISFLLDNNDVRIRLAEAGRSFVRRLDWEHSTDLMEKFLIRAKESQPIPYSFGETLPKIDFPWLTEELDATRES